MKVILIANAPASSILDTATSIGRRDRQYSPRGRIAFETTTHNSFHIAEASVSATDKNGVRADAPLLNQQSLRGCNANYS